MLSLKSTCETDEKIKYELVKKFRQMYREANLLVYYFALKILLKNFLKVF